MKPVSLSYSSTIGAPIERVFALISDPARIPEWLPRCTGVQPDEERKGKGARHRIRFEHGGKRHEAVIEVIEYQPPTGYGWIEHYRRRGSKTFFGLNYAGGATRISMKHIWVPAGWHAWILGQFYRRRNANRMFEALVNNLQRIVTQ